MNTSSATSAGGEGGGKPSPILIGETKDKKSIETDPNKGAQEEDVLPPNSSSVKSTSKNSSGGPTKEGDAKASPSRQVPAGSKRKEQHDDSAASTQVKKPRMEPTEIPSETRGVATAAAIDDAHTESEDEYSSAGAAQKSPEAFDPDTEQDKKPAAAKEYNAASDTSLEAKVAASFKEQQEANELLGSASPYEHDKALERKVRRKDVFPVTLYQLLEEDDYKDACCWLPDGLAFALDPEIFTRKVVDVLFPGSKFDSFKRKLNRWGFRRVMESEAPGTMTYYHRLFRRGYPGLLKQMNGGRIVASKHKLPPASLSDGVAAAPSSLPALELSADQQVLLAAMLRGGGAVAGGLGSLIGGGETMGGGLSSLLAGGISMMAPQQQTSSDTADAMEQILIEQKRLRQELTMKNQNELELRQKLNEEVLRRRTQEDQMREILLASPLASVPASAAASSQGLASQFTQMPPTGFGDTTGMSTGMLPGMSQFSQQQAAVTLSEFPLQQGQSSMAQFLLGQGVGQQPGMMAVDPSAALLAPAPAAAALATNELPDLARFQNMNQQQEQDFLRRVQEELARRENNS